MTEKRITAILGDHWHGAGWSRAALAGALAGDPFSTLETVEEPDFKAALARRPHVLVIFREGVRRGSGGEVLGPALGDGLLAGIERHVREGAGLLAWHSGLAGYEAHGAYLRMLGGRFMSHPKVQQVRYSGAWPSPTPGHAPAQALSFAAQDEHYFVECNASATQVFLHSHSADGASFAGWRHSWGAGRVLCLTPAHTQEGLSHPAFTALLRQCLAWLAGDSPP